MAKKSFVIGFLESVYCLWIKAVSCLQPVFLLIIRLYWGWQFFLTGKGKLTDLNKVTNFFASIHIPYPHVNAIMAGCTECGGGLLLLLGLGSRIFTIPLIFTMVIAYITTEQEALHALYSDPDKFVSAAPFQFMLTAIIVLIFGPGIFSLDALIGRRFFKNGAPGCHTCQRLRTGRRLELDFKPASGYIRWNGGRRRRGSPPRRERPAGYTIILASLFGL